MNPEGSVPVEGFDSDEVFGGMSVQDRLKMLSDWLPVLAKLGPFAAAKTTHERLLAIIGLLRVAADKTGTTKDNLVLDHIERLLRTPEGIALVDWLASVAGDIK